MTMKSWETEQGALPKVTYWNRRALEKMAGEPPLRTYYVANT